MPAKLEDIANHEKKMPANFIRADGYGITPACRRYLQPLIQGEAPTPFDTSGLPHHARPKLHLLKRRLPAWTG